MGYSATKITGRGENGGGNFLGKLKGKAVTLSLSKRAAEMESCFQDWVRFDKLSVTAYTFSYKKLPIIRCQPSINRSELKSKARARAAAGSKA